MNSANNTEDLIAGRSGLNGISMSTETVDEAGTPLTSVPSNAQYAFLVLEAYNLSEAERPLCCRWSDTSDSNTVSDNIGLPLGHLGMIELKGKHSIANFNIIMISTVTSGYPKLRVLYYE